MTSKTETARASQDNTSQSKLNEQEEDLLEGLSSFDELFDRFYGHLSLDELKSRVLAGDPMALLAAVGKCLGTETKAPDWVRCGFLAAVCSYRYGVVRSLDEAFHVTRPSNWRRKRAIKNSMDFELWRLVEEHKMGDQLEGSRLRPVFEIVAEVINKELNEKFQNSEEDYKIGFYWQDVQNAFNRVQEFISKRS